MGYDHSSSDFESGDSMSRNETGDSKSSSKPKPKPPVPSAATCRCSYCGTPFERSETKHMPFCSKRCQQVDLGMWLNESYGFPYEGDGTAESFRLQSDEDDA